MDSNNNTPEELYYNKEFIKLLYSRYLHYKYKYNKLEDKYISASCSHNCIYKHTLSNINASLRRYKSFYIKYYKTFDEDNIPISDYFSDVVDVNIDETYHNLPPLPSSGSESDTELESESD
jgi:hypothetical protein